MISQRLLKFRVWSQTDKCWVPFEQTLLICHSGEPLIATRDAQPIKLWNLTQHNCIVQQFTGVKDVEERDVYEGDLVRFEYRVGDFAWEHMTPEEEKANKKMLGTIYECVVEWDENHGAFVLRNGPKDGTHTMFPLPYVKSGVIYGHVFQKICA